MPCLVQHVDQVHQILRRAVARGRREVAGGLVAPRAVERVLGDRQQLDVGEALPRTYSASGARDLAVGRGACRSPGRGATSRGAPRRSTSARRARCARGASCHPRGVAPRVLETARRARRSPAALQRRTRTDRPCRCALAVGPDDRGTCRRSPDEPALRGLPRRPRRHSGAATGRRPAASRSSRRSPKPPGHSAPTRERPRRRRRAGIPCDGRAARAILPERNERPARRAARKASATGVKGRCTLRAAALPDR